MRIARDELRRVRELTRSIDALQRELATLVAAPAPQLLDERGCGVLSAAKLIGEIAGIQRFASDAQARSARRLSADPRIVWKHHSPSPRPWRQPPAKRAAPLHRHQRPLGPRQ